MEDFMWRLQSCLYKKKQRGCAVKKINYGTASFFMIDYPGRGVEIPALDG